MEKYATHNAPVKQVSCTIAALLLLIVISPLWAGGEETANHNTQPSDSPNAVRIGPKYTLTRGNQFELCRNYVDLMNRVKEVEQKPTDSHVQLPFPFDELAKKQGFRAIRWREERDKNHYKAILREYYIFSKVTRLNWRKYKTQQAKEAFKAKMLAYYNPEFETFFYNIRHLWRTRMDINFDGKADTVYHIAHCRDEDRFCTDFTILYDLSQPDFHFDDGYTHDMRGYLFYYKGRPYNDDGGMIIELKTGIAVCEFMSTKSWKEVQRHNEQLRQQQARQKALESQGHDHD